MFSLPLPSSVRNLRKFLKSNLKLPVSDIEKEILASYNLSAIVHLYFYKT